MRASEAGAAREALPPEVAELSALPPADFVAQFRHWHKLVKARFELVEASGWAEEASNELAQLVTYVVRRGGGCGGCAGAAGTASSAARWPRSMPAPTLQAPCHCLHAPCTPPLISMQAPLSLVLPQRAQRGPPHLF